ncbi:Uncharacterised protein [Mycobacteroides abscessus subsp. abscessus]|nr:Uncharacterised protein [Mycobacteroides abscessus subsp. abscessus]
MLDSGTAAGVAAYTTATPAGRRDNYCRGLALTTRLCTYPRRAPTRATPPENTQFDIDKIVASERFWAVTRDL